MLIIFSKSHWAIAFIILACSLSLLSCKEQNNYKKISFDLNNSSLPTFIEIDRIIYLETNDNSLIGEIHKIEYHKGVFYVLDRMVARNIFLFDSVGKYITSLKRGHGPGEILNPTEFIINQSSDIVLVWDQLTN